MRVSPPNTTTPGRAGCFAASSAAARSRAAAASSPAISATRTPPLAGTANSCDRSVSPSTTASTVIVVPGGTSPNCARPCASVVAFSVRSAAAKRDRMIGDVVAHALAHQAHGHDARSPAPAPAAAGRPSAMDRASAGRGCRRGAATARTHASDERSRACQADIEACCRSSCRTARRIVRRHAARAQAERRRHRRRSCSLADDSAAAAACATPRSASPAPARSRRGTRSGVELTHQPDRARAQPAAHLVEVALARSFPIAKSNSSSLIERRTSVFSRSSAARARPTTCAALLSGFGRHQRRRARDTRRARRGSRRRRSGSGR